LAESRDPRRIMDAAAGAAGSVMIALDVGRSGTGTKRSLRSSAKPTDFDPTLGEWIYVRLRPSEDLTL
jgi:hypothetical protein